MLDELNAIGHHLTGDARATLRAAIERYDGAASQDDGLLDTVIAWAHGKPKPAPSDADDREALIGLSLATKQYVAGDGLPAMKVRTNEQAADLVLDAGFSRSQPVPSDAWTRYAATLPGLVAETPKIQAAFMAGYASQPVQVTPEALAAKLYSIEYQVDPDSATPDDVDERLGAADDLIAWFAEHAPAQPVQVEVTAALERLADQIETGWPRNAVVEPVITLIREEAAALGGGESDVAPADAYCTICHRAGHHNLDCDELGGGDHAE